MIKCFRNLSFSLKNIQLGCNIIIRLKQKFAYLQDVQFLKIPSHKFTSNLAILQYNLPFSLIGIYNDSTLAPRINYSAN